MGTHPIFESDFDCLTDGHDTLSAAFQCLVCMAGLQDAHLCPKCSKFFCKECIIRWVSRHRQCPHCRCALSESGLVKCGWVSDVTATIARLESSLESWIIIVIFLSFILIIWVGVDYNWVPNSSVAPIEWFGSLPNNS